MCLDRAWAQEQLRADLTGGCAVGHEAGDMEFMGGHDEEAMTDLRRMVEVDAVAGTVGREITALPAGADEAARQRLATRLAPTLAQHLLAYPWLSDPAGHLSKSLRVTRETFTESVRELYNPAQVDVLARAGVFARERLRRDDRAVSRRST